MLSPRPQREAGPKTEHRAVALAVVRPREGQPPVVADLVGQRQRQRRAELAIAAWTCLRDEAETRADPELDARVRPKLISRKAVLHVDVLDAQVRHDGMLRNVADLLAEGQERGTGVQL